MQDEGLPCLCDRSVERAARGPGPRAGACPCLLLMPAPAPKHSSILCPTPHLQEVDPNPDLSEVEGLGGLEGEAGFLADISTSIPGIDEAMSFAEVMKQVGS